jgi:hypothetical protein
MYAKKAKVKTALRINYTAQTIVSELNESLQRSLDYLMSVNTLTSYLLLLVNKPNEALEFVRISERIALRMLEYTQKQFMARHNLVVVEENQTKFNPYDT